MLICSRCNQSFDENDPDIEQRKARHVQGRHTHHYTINQRDNTLQSKSGMGGLDLGEVVWIKNAKT